MSKLAKQKEGVAFHHGNPCTRQCDSVRFSGESRPVGGSSANGAQGAEMLVPAGRWV
jgi:hypothetical protein